MENWERRVQPLMKRERRGPPLRGVTHQVLEVPVSLREKCGGIVTSYFVNTGLKKKSSSRNIFKAGIPPYTILQGSIFFFFFLSGESSAVAYFSIQPEIAEYWMPDTLTVLGASSTCHGGGSFSFPIIYSILNDNLGAPGVHLICL